MVDLIKRQVIGFTLRTCWRPPSHQFLLFCGFHEGEGLGATLRVVGLSETRCLLDGSCEVGREEINANCEMICIFFVPAYYYYYYIEYDSGTVSRSFKCSITITCYQLVFTPWLALKMTLHVKTPFLPFLLQHPRDFLTLLRRPRSTQTVS